LNRRIWDEIKNPTTEEGKRVADALSRAGMGSVQAPNGQTVIRQLTEGELKDRGLTFVKGQGWITK
jgi:hypothetical protein